jgi:hypothetical protein
MRFTGITIPQGSTITAAYLSFKASEADSVATVNCRIWGENVATPATYSTLTNFNARTKTSTSVDWNPIGTWAVNKWYNSPSLVTVVQELVNARAYSNGAMAFIVNDISSTADAIRAFCQYNDSPSEAPKLHIEYTTMAAPRLP